MSLFGALALGAVSGAGTAVQKSSQLDQQAELDIEKAKTIDANKLSLTDQYRKEHAKEFNDVSTQIADQMRSDFLKGQMSKYNTKDYDKDGNHTGTHSLTAEDLTPEDRLKYEAFTPFHKDVVLKAGVQTGFIQPEDMAKLGQNQDKIEAMIQRNTDLIANAKDRIDLQLQIAQMRQGFGQDSRAQLVASVSLVDARLRGYRTDYTQANKDREAFLQDPLSNSLKKQIDKNTGMSEYDKRLADIDGRIADTKANLHATEIMSDALLGTLGLGPKATPSNAKDPDAKNMPKPTVTDAKDVSNLRTQAEKAIADGKDPNGVKAKYKSMTGKDY